MNATLKLFAELQEHLNEFMYALEDEGETEAARSQALHMIEKLEAAVDGIDNGTLEDPTGASWRRTVTPHA